MGNNLEILSMLKTQNFNIRVVLDNPKINGLYKLVQVSQEVLMTLLNLFSRIQTKQQVSNTSIHLQKESNINIIQKLNIKKLRDSGYKKSFFSLEEGIKDYIREYLRK